MHIQTTYSLIHWHCPQKQAPQEASYILIRQDLGDGTIFCGEAAYENRAYWYLFPDASVPIIEETITGWAYFPYDDRRHKKGRGKPD